LRDPYRHQPGPQADHASQGFVCVALALGYVSGCASIAAYQANHPYYKFPGGGGGGGGNGG
jgi:hypothetical protein